MDPQKNMVVNDREIGNKHKPYIIAELSANHGGDISRAKRSIRAAYECGVDAVKIQTYTPDTMTIDCEKSDFKISDGIWAGTSLYNLYKTAYTPFEWHKELFAFARELRITLFSTPFDETAVDLLEDLDAPAYKVASFELTDLPLIEYIAKKNKPIFMSTGMGSMKEVEEAVSTIRLHSDNALLLFHCVSSYPAPTEQSNLSNISELQKRFGVEVGLSDHTLSNLSAVVAVGLGAVAIEKHFKLDEADLGPDASFSLTPKELSSLVEDTREAWLAKGNEGFNRSDAEEATKLFRRSVYFVNDIAPGQTVGELDVRRIRPGYGLEPKYMKDVIGKTVVRGVERGDPVTWDCFDTKNGG